MKSDLAALAGLALIVAGVAKFSAAAAMIVAGAIIIFVVKRSTEDRG